MRNEVLIIDLANTIFSKTIRSRQNDKGGLKLTVYLKENGRPINLTGYTVKYEAINNAGKFTRDDAVIVDAAKGIIEYVFSKEAVSTPGEWDAYFVCEKNETERFSTQDIKITLGRDVKQGNFKISNYISDFDKALEIIKSYRKDIDDATALVNQLKQLVEANNVQVPKITNQDGTPNISITDVSKNILNEILSKGAGMSTVYCVSGAQGQTPNNKTFRGISYLSDNSNGFILVKDSQNKLFTNYLDNGTWSGWQENVHKGDFVGWIFDAQGFKRNTDSGWNNLSTTGVTIVPDRPMKYKRNGDQVNLIGSIKNPQNVSVFATLPSGFRPVQSIASSVVMVSGSATPSCELTIQSDGGIFVNGTVANSTIHIAVSFLI
ncbi:phage baseplate upper protein [Bacillus cereus]|nr:phage baseplate upper protein [Bacillus cereus]